MLERFQGTEGTRRLTDALRTQRIVSGDLHIARELTAVVALHEFAAGQVLLEQDGADNELYFILTGSVVVMVNGRVVATRTSGTHVGEMAMIDPSARRSATVIARVPTVVAALSEAAFVVLANERPELWRHIAIELCERLRQRNCLVRAVNAVPFLFVGSSAESLPIAREVQDALAYDSVTVKVWTNKVFGASHFPLENLETTIAGADFGLLVIGPDDQVVSREQASEGPRDNIVLELGMCFGALSRQRTFMLQPRGLDLKIPTDLTGLAPLEYDPGATSDLAAALGPACNHLRAAIQRLGCR